MAQELERNDREHQKYEAARDELFAKRIQALEMSQAQRQAPPSRRAVPLPSPRETQANPMATKLSSVAQVHRPEPEGTPPLPVLSNGDVPREVRQEDDASVSHMRDTSFHDLRGGLKYNDEQYLVKLARPAVVTTEPLYANNKPEHYAVSNPLTERDGAVGGAAGGVGPAIDLSPELLGAAGLSQRDLVRNANEEGKK